MQNNELLKLMSYLLLFPEEDMKFLKVDDLSSYEDKQVQDMLTPFIEYLQNNSLEDLQRKYVDFFDFNEKTNLYLTYSRLKEERERGKVLVKLKQIYKDEGFMMNDEELPDYLPLVLEFFTIAKIETSIHIFQQFEKMIVELSEELRILESPYANIIEVILFILNKEVRKGGAA